MSRRRFPGNWFRFTLTNSKAWLLGVPFRLERGDDWVLASRINGGRMPYCTQTMLQRHIRRWESKSVSAGRPSAARLLRC